MTSERRLQANRANATRSTGPRTAEGKQAVRLNALKHGLLAQDALLPGESAAALDALLDELEADLQPVGALEWDLLGVVVGYRWRLGRVFQVEGGLFSAEIYPAQAHRIRRRALASEGHSSGGGPAFPLQPDREDERVRADALQGLAESEAVDLGEAFCKHAALPSDVFSKLSRYEASIVRAYFRAINEFVAAQQRRLASDEARAEADIDEAMREAARWEGASEL